MKDLKDLVDNKICDILTIYMENLDHNIFHIGYFKKVSNSNFQFVEILQLLPIVKKSDFPASRIKKILKNWMLLCAKRMVIV